MLENGYVVKLLSDVICSPVVEEGVLVKSSLEMITPSALESRFVFES